MWEKKVWILYQYLKILLSSARLKRMYCWTLYIVISFFKCYFCKISRKLSNNLNLKRKWPRFLMYLLLSRCLLTYIENIVKKVQCQMCVWVSQIFPLMLNSKFEKKKSISLNWSFWWILRHCALVHSVLMNIWWIMYH